jgi:hypothetical protein
MGQASNELNDIPAVAAEVDALRERTQSLVGELERRLRERATRAKALLQRGRGTLARVRHTFDIKAQLQEHPRIVIGVGAAATLALGIGVYYSVVRWRERQRPLARLRTRIRSYRALRAQPERERALQEPLGKRLLTAVLVAGAVTLTRGLALLFVKRAVQPRLPPPTTPR